MIIERYLVKEIASNFFAVLFVILLIFGGNHFVRFMAEAASGDIPATYIFRLLSTFIISQLMLLIPAALYIAVLVTMGRWYRDNEVTAMMSCGLGLAKIIRPVAFVGFIISVAVAVLSLWVTPWAERTVYELRLEAKTVSEIEAIAPGRFHKIEKGNGVFYIEGTNPDNNALDEVFVFLEGPQGMQMFAATSGQQKNNEDGDFLSLRDGSLLQFGGAEELATLINYKSAEIRLNRSEYISTRVKAREKPLLELFESDRSSDYAEIQWRFSIPIACFLLVLLALFLSKTDPRQGRFGKLFVAILIYIVYIYSMILGKNWIKQDALPLGMLWIHLTVLAGVFFMARRTFGFKRTRLV